MIALTSTHVEVLKKLYINANIATDAYVPQWDDLVRLVRAFSQAVGAPYKPGEILAFMINERKSGRWPRIMREYRGRELKRA